jgi:RNA polymerase sigma factor (TIGR02999 family)
MSDVTRILGKIECGDPSAAEQLLPLIYDELRALAAAKMADEAPDHTLQPTALVHEAYIRLVDVDQAQHWDSRGHFFSAAAEAMRRILVDAARRKQSLRYGGDRERCELRDDDLCASGPQLDLLALDELIARLEQDHPHAAGVVKLRFFCGMTIAEVAESLGLSHATVERYWAYSKARLHSELSAL